MSLYMKCLGKIGDLKALRNSLRWLIPDALMMVMSEPVLMAMSGSMTLSQQGSGSMSMACVTTKVQVGILGLGCTSGRVNDCEPCCTGPPLLWSSHSGASCGMSAGGLAPPCVRSGTQNSWLWPLPPWYPTSMWYIQLSHKREVVGKNTYSEFSVNFWCPWRLSWDEDRHSTMALGSDILISGEIGQIN